MIVTRLYKVFINDKTGDVKIRGHYLKDITSYQFEIFVDGLNIHTIEGYRDATDEETKIELEKLKVEAV